MTIFILLYILFVYIFVYFVLATVPPFVKQLIGIIKTHSHLGLTSAFVFSKVIEAMLKNAKAKYLKSKNYTYWLVDTMHPLYLHYTCLVPLVPASYPLYLIHTPFACLIPLLPASYLSCIHCNCLVTLFHASYPLYLPHIPCTHLIPVSYPNTCLVPFVPIFYPS